MDQVGKFFSKKIQGGFTNLEWLIQEMDMTQWGIVAVVFVITGFLALKTKF